MFKDYNKYLSTSLKVYLFVLIIIFIMKMWGLDYFNINYDHKIIMLIDTKLNIPIINNFIQFLIQFIQLYMLAYITIKSKPKILEIILITLINIITSYFIFKYNLDYLYTFSSIIIFIVYFILKGIKLRRIFCIVIINILLQALSTITRNNSFTEYSFTISIILNIDYMLMLLIYCELVKEGKILCLHLGSYSLKKLNLRNLLKKLQKNLHNFKKQDKVTKLTIIIYLIFSILWNTLSVVVVLFVANLNNTFIECIFILTSFWLSKKSFGKAFHLPSMSQCFVVSNLSYYILNRLTTPLGISIIIPIMLGVGLSYITSKLVKKTYKPLYRGMPEDLFEETIIKVVDKNSLKYKICYEFYIKKKSVVSLSIKYNYTEAGIRKIKDRINEKIKGLN